MKKTLLKNGLIITNESSYIGSIGIKDGLIYEIGSIKDESFYEEIINVEGKYLLPGGIDSHTHMEMPFGGTTSTDTYESGSKAAISSGVTTFIDYVIQKRKESLIDALSRRLNISLGYTYCDFAFHIAVTDLNKKALNDIKFLRENGVSSLKCFTVYRKDKLMLNEKEIQKILKYCKKYNIQMNIHAEDVYLLEKNIAQLIEENSLSSYYHYVSRNEEVETLGVKRAIECAIKVDAPLHIVHVATNDAIDIIKKAKSEGHKITMETCPTYLQFNSNVYKEDNGYIYVCSPSIKQEPSRLALWDAIKDGSIDTIATDHCPFLLKEKQWGEDDFRKTPNGCGGIDIVYPYLLSAANKGLISFPRVVELFCYNPSKLFHLTQKGSLDIGKDADIVIYNPKGKKTYKISESQSLADVSIWENYEFEGVIESTYLRGELAYNDKKILINEGFGKFLKRD